MKQASGVQWGYSLLLMLAIKALPVEHRLRGIDGWTVITVSVLTAVLAVYTGVFGAGMWGPHG